MPKLGDLPIGSKIKFGKIYGESIIWVVADKNHSGYPNNSTTLLTNNIIKFMCFDGAEPFNRDSDRKSDGNNRYIYSNIRQWLNSTAAAGKWYTAQHDTDAPPSSANVCDGYNPYDNEAGFLSGFNQKDRDILLSTTHTVGRATIDGGGTETVTDKIFLLSCTEVCLTGDAVCGSKLAIFSDNNSRIAYPTTRAVSNNMYSNVATNKPRWWWLSDAGVEYSHYACTVQDNGSLFNWGGCCYTGYGGLRPACNLPSTAFVSSTTDADDCYVIVDNLPPIVTSNKASGSNLSEVSAPFDFKYTVNDENGDTVTVKEYLDNALIKSYTAALGAENSFETVSDPVLFQKILNGQHTIKVVGDDGIAGESKPYTVTFNKQVRTTSITLAEPLPADDVIKAAVVSITGNIPQDAAFEVLVTNNALDENPVWEDMSREVLQSTNHVFENKTAANGFAFNFKVTAARGASGEQGFISSIGGAFE